MIIPCVENEAAKLRTHILILESWLKCDLSDDDYIQAQRIGTHYLVVAAYGIIEQQVKNRIINYVSENKIAIYAREPIAVKDLIQKISQMHSWDFNVIQKVVAHIDKKLHSQVVNDLTHEQKRSITSLKNNRNAIAHGDSNDATFDETKEQITSSMEGLCIISDIISRGTGNGNP